jgi:hypothetical protein
MSNSFKFTVKIRGKIEIFFYTLKSAVKGLSVTLFKLAIHTALTGITAGSAALVVFS